MRRTVGMIALVMALADSTVAAQQELPFPSDPTPASRASSNPLGRSARWFRDKLTAPSSTAKDPVELDGPPRPPSPGRSVMRSVAPRSLDTVTEGSRSATGHAIQQVSPGGSTKPGEKSADELRVEQQVSGIEHLLKAEEARLGQQVARFTQMREAALKKEDSNALKQIEQMERQMVGTYQKRIEQILSRIPATTAGSESNPAARSATAPPHRRPVPPSAARSNRGGAR